MSPYNKQAKNPKRGARWGGLSSQRGRFTPRNDSAPTEQEAGWAPEPAWTVQKISPPLPPPHTQEFDPRTVQPVASRYTDYAIQARFNTIG
jgi:hypothetical protein